jgi:transcription antitermination protein NusB
MGRELALKALYRIDICGGASSDDLAALFETTETDSQTRVFANALIDGVRKEERELDKQIAAALEHWSVKRLSRVDHNIMRIAVFELLHMSDVPTRVTIDEAIELAKTYGDEGSGRFVNGVLDHIAEANQLKGKGEDRPRAKHG